MTQRPTAIERAFELAKSGSVGTLTELQRELKKEGYASEALLGPALRAQLRRLIYAARVLGA